MDDPNDPNDPDDTATMIGILVICFAFTGGAIAGTVIARLFWLH